MSTLAYALPNVTLRFVPDATTDVELVEAVLRGRTDCFDRLIARYRPQARAIAGRVLRHDQSGLEDVIAEANCRAFSHLGHLRDGSRFRSWYCAIVRNAALDYAMKIDRLLHQPDVARDLGRSD